MLYCSTLQHLGYARTPRNRKPVVLQGPSQPHLAAVLVYTIERQNRTHKAVINNHIIGLNRITYSVREQSTVIDMSNEKDERQ